MKTMVLLALLAVTGCSKYPIPTTLATTATYSLVPSGPNGCVKYQVTDCSDSRGNHWKPRKDHVCYIDDAEALTLPRDSR